MDIFASQETSHCQQWFSLREGDATLGVDTLAHEWPRVLLLRFSSESYNTSSAAEDEERQTQGDSDSSPLVRPAVVSRADDTDCHSQLRKLYRVADMRFIFPKVEDIHRLVQRTCPS